MIQIQPRQIKDCEVTVPGSKSYTHRFLIAAALSDGPCTIRNGLKSEDTYLTLDALRQMGVKIDVEEDQWTVQGTRGELSPCDTPIYLGNSGTSMRLLTAVAAVGKGKYTLTGTARMQQRPIQDLIEGLRQIGVKARAVNPNGCPPVEISGGTITGGPVGLNCKTSSQFLSALLLIAPYTRKGLDIAVLEGPVSRPYIDMTVDVMEKLGVKILRNGYESFKVSGGQAYQAGAYQVEPDASQAGYFWAAAAITGAGIKIKGISKGSRQGDVHFTEFLEAMGCRIVQEKDGIRVFGGPLTAIEADMADMPDMVPTLAVVAAFAKGKTVIRNVAHLRTKESDRLAAVATELSKMGIQADCHDTGLVIQGGHPRGADIETYRDHRIAMSFAVAGLKVPGVVIQDEQCVEKSFPDFWRVFQGLCGG